MRERDELVSLVAAFGTADSARVGQLVGLHGATHMRTLRLVCSPAGAGGGNLDNSCLPGPRIPLAASSGRDTVPSVEVPKLGGRDGISPGTAHARLRDRQAVDDVRGRHRRLHLSPSYYVVVRDGGKLHRERVGRNRKMAERALTKRQAEEDDGAFVPQKTIRFDEWADRWLAGLERKPNTVDGYRTTMRYAKQAFGDVVVRRLTVEHVKTFLRVCSEARRGEGQARDERLHPREALVRRLIADEATTGGRRSASGLM